MHHLLVVDDTPLGIQAGKAAGCLTVAVSNTGNALGLGLDELEALPERELGARIQQIGADFRANGADFVIPSLADLPDLLTTQKLLA
jgi:phosphonoacetaldehyde hydrolase